MNVTRIALLPADEEHATPPELLLTAGSPDFVSCQGCRGVQVELAEPTLLSAVRLSFLGSTESETWNSWLRAPRLPPGGELGLSSDGASIPATERRAPIALLPGAAVGDATQVLLRFAERELTHLVVHFPPGPWALASVSVVSSPTESTALTWPPMPTDLESTPRPQPALPHHGDAFSEQLRTLVPGRTPTLDDVWQLALPYRGGALLGFPEGAIAYQLWNGSLVVRTAGGGERALLSLHCDGEPIAVASDEQRLGDGYLPIGRLSGHAGAVHLDEEALVDGTGALRLRLAIQNRDERARTVALRATAARRVAARNDPKLQAEIHAPLRCTMAPDTNGELRLTESLGEAPAEWSVAAGEAIELQLRLPLARPQSPVSAVATATELKAESDQFLGSGTQLDLPDPRLMNLWRALLLHTRLFVRGGVMRYGLFPGLYEDGLFGVEEGWNIVSLAQYGHSAAAAATLERTFFDAEFLKKEGPHHQYRNGLAITYALDVGSLTRDQALLRRLWPTVKESAGWIAQAFASTQLLDDGQRPPHFGLMPRHIYGGDLRAPAYSLYASSACWRGLRDAARMAELLEERDAAQHFGRVAATARSDLWTAAERIYKPDGTPPFLPFRTDESAATPSSGDYYQLFASLVLETAAFGWQGRWARTLTDYLEQTGRMVLGVPRFDVWFGRLGVDAEYARGTQLALLQRREFDRFYLGLLGQLGLSCDPQTFVSPETTVVRFTGQEQADRLRVLATQAARADSDPCSAGTGVMLQYLRYLLACEERDEADLPTGNLWLGAAAPPEWFAAGKSFAAQRLPTLNGELSFRCHSDGKWVVYDLSLDTPTPSDIELFYFTSDRQRRSQRIRVQGAAQVELPRL